MRINTVKKHSYLLWGYLALIVGLIFLVSGEVRAHQSTESNDTLTVVPLLDTLELNGEGTSHYLDLDIQIVDSHPEDLTEDTDGDPVWSTGRYLYKYVAGSPFYCGAKFFDIPNEYELEDWLDKNGYSDQIYQQQKAVFKIRASTLFQLYIESESGITTSITQNLIGDLTPYKDGSAQLGLCIRVKHRDDSHSTIHSLILNLNDLANSQVDVGLEGSEPGTISNQDASQPDSQPDSQTDNQSDTDTASNTAVNDGNQAPTEDDADSNVLLIVGIIVGILSLGGVIVLVIFLMKKRRPF